MSVEIKAVGGWGEVGKNMTAVRVDNDVVIFDMGLHLPNYIKVTETEPDEYSKVTESSLRAADAVPNDTTIKNWKPNVRAIVVTHAHLDHVGAIPYVANKYLAPVICTPFTAAILRALCRDAKISLRNKIIELKPGKTHKLTNNLQIEFIHTTHSTPQTIIAALHTPEGIIVYGNDYKLDNTPVLGKEPDYARFKQLGKIGVLALIQDCIYAGDRRHTPSETVAKELLRENLLEIDTKGKGIIVTTFASHIARLKTIAEFGKQLKRKVIIMGRSMSKYSYAAKDSGVTDLSRMAKIITFARQIRRTLKEVQERGKHRYLLVVSGHQGEPKSALSKMANGIYNWNFDGDHVIFSAHVIPADINRENREKLDSQLISLGARLFTDVHVSGHSSGEDMRDIITMLKPAHLFPTHGERDMMHAFNQLAKEMGYTLSETLHPIVNGESIVFD